MSFQNAFYAVAAGSGNQVDGTRGADGVSVFGWQSVGGNATRAPAAARNGQLYLFVRGADRRLYTRSGQSSAR